MQDEKGGGGILRRGIPCGKSTSWRLGTVAEYWFSRRRRIDIRYHGPVMTYQIVRYRSEHRNRLLELQTHLWGADPVLNAAYLKWKYERNPYCGTPFFVVAMDGDRIVGTCGQFGTRWQVGYPPRTLNWLCGADMVIAPEYRGTDLSDKLIETMLDELAAAGYTHTLTLSAVPVSFWACMKWGWRGPGSFRTMRKETRRGQVRRLGRGLSSRLSPTATLSKRHGVPSSDVSAEAFAALDRVADQNGEPIDGRICVREAPRPAAMAELIAQIPSDGRIRHARDEAFFSWRFADPFRTFRFLYWDDDGLQGYLILSARRSASLPTRIAIVDWEAKDPLIRNALLRAVTDWGRFDSLTIWSATLPEEAKALLRAAGFRFVRPRITDRTGRLEPNWPGLLIRPTMGQGPGGEWRIGGRDLLDISNWDLCQAYSD